MDSMRTTAKTKKGRAARSRFDRKKFMNDIPPEVTRGRICQSITRAKKKLEQVAVCAVPSRDETARSSEREAKLALE
jgi:hypothetical protein